MSNHDGEPWFEILWPTLSNIATKDSLLHGIVITMPYIQLSQNGIPMSTLCLSMSILAEAAVSPMYNRWDAQLILRLGGLLSILSCCKLIVLLCAWWQHPCWWSDYHFTESLADIIPLIVMLSWLCHTVTVFLDCCVVMAMSHKFLLIVMLSWLHHVVTVFIDYCVIMATSHSYCVHMLFLILTHVSLTWPCIDLPEN